MARSGIEVEDEIRTREDTQTGAITYVTGDAVEPDFPGSKIVAFMTNDATPNWGGGIASQIARRKPEIQTLFRNLAKTHPETLQLGKAIFLKHTETLSYAALVAQHGLGKSDAPRIRYDALAGALKKLGARAADIEASVHMPRIGTGVAGGSWELISPLIEEYVCPFADVRVYDLAKRPMRRAKEAS